MKVNDPEISKKEQIFGIQDLQCKEIEAATNENKKHPGVTAPLKEEKSCGPKIRMKIKLSHRSVE